MIDGTQILSQIGQGDPSAAEQLLMLGYDELSELAVAMLASQKPGQTLQATASAAEMSKLLEIPRLRQAKHQP